MTLAEYTKALASKKITVVGIGVSNTPLIRHLAVSGCKVTACDRSGRDKLGDLADELESIGVTLKLGEDYLSDIDADVIFRTPGMRPDLPELLQAAERGAVITSEMEAFFAVCPCRIIAVTGSDGKTTTTTVISELLKAEGYRVHLGGNIGNPLLYDADSMLPEDIAVLELSSFQLMTMHTPADIAVVTNLSPNHLDVHKDMDEYVAAKKNIFIGQNSNGVLVLNEDNEITKSFVGDSSALIKCFSRFMPISDGAFLKDGDIYLAHGGTAEKLMSASEIFLPGVHNIENYMAAFSAVDGLVSPETMVSVAKTFKGVEHRIEFIREYKGVKYYNDSIASSPSRTIAGLRSFKDKLVLIAGGKDKGVPFDVLGPEIIEHVKLLVLTGLTAEKIRAAVENTPGYSGSPEIIVVPDFKDAALTAAGKASPGDTVILSPACTSFDRFKNFAERGRVFKDIINSLEDSGI